MEKPNNTKCSLCGKKITVAYLYDGKVFGSSCIKKKTGKTCRELNLKRAHIYKILEIEKYPNSLKIDIALELFIENGFQRGCWITDYSEDRIIDGYYITSERFKKPTFRIKVKK